MCNMGVARALASRYRRRGIADDDLEQVAYLGLVKAVHGFDLSYERDFLAYAVPTIRGEIKRWFRDHGWAVRPPRRIQELQAQVNAADNQLSQQLGRSPRPREVAEWLQVDEDQVIEALACLGSFTPASLDQLATDGTSATFAELLQITDHTPALIEARMLLAPAVKRLSKRHQQILYLRYFEGLTQTEIGRQVGLSQMHVSRLLSRIHRQLQTSITDESQADGDTTSRANA